MRIAKLVLSCLAVSVAVAAATAPTKAEAPPARSTLCARYVNSTDYTVPVGDYKGADAVVPPIVVTPPPGAVGVCGWQLGAFAKDRTSLWTATVWLRVNGEDVAHFKPRTSAQDPLFMAPTPYLLEDGPVEIHAKLFNEDVKPVRVRVNAWVWFAMETY